MNENNTLCKCKSCMSDWELEEVLFEMDEDNSYDMQNDSCYDLVGNDTNSEVYQGSSTYPECFEDYSDLSPSIEEIDDSYDLENDWYDYCE